MGKEQHKTVAPVGGYAGPRAFQNAGGAVAVSNGGSQLVHTVAVGVYLIDVLIDQLAFLTINLAATGSGYPIASGVPYRIPVEPGDQLYVIGSTSGGTAYVHPVRGDLDNEV